MNRLISPNGELITIDFTKSKSDKFQAWIKLFNS